MPLVIVLVPTVMPAAVRLIVPHVLSPRKYVVELAVPVTAVMLLVPMPIVFVRIPDAGVPRAGVTSVADVSVGDVARTTLPEPVDAVVHEIAVPLVAVQKSLVVRVPKVVVLDDPIAIQPEPLQ